ncbi:Ribosome-binding factor A [Candidatus Desulfarcum epimagneticum]|uniref:Ribosome-binding factor A n=1 Tax=uncultured Desulfobacteraceae bacterium TaxID=218296 RepID=A0A484HKM5_9BACT|nr:Ribosome-binding factor A [uncultured Desulfobacteraceae bacterium]
MTFTRADRVSGLIRKNLSDMIQKEIGDPRLESAVITKVKMSADLRLATVYFSISGSKKAQKEAVGAFGSARGFIKKKLARRLGLRYMPDIRFFYDESFDYAARIENLLDSIKDQNE